MTDLAIRERVAREVMGLDVAGRGRWSERMCCYILACSGDDLLRPEDKEGEHYPLPTYETDIAAAWQVVEKMRERGWSMDLTTRRHGGLTTIEMFDADGTFVTAEAATAPMAICLAALAALEAK